MILIASVKSDGVRNENTSTHTFNNVSLGIVRVERTLRGDTRSETVGLSQ